MNSKSLLISTRRICLASLFLLGLQLSIYAPSASALPVSAGPTANVSFTFDDGLNSTVTQAAPALAPYGIVGTSYVTTGCIGMTTIPNTCRADTMEKYMTWQQVRQLQTQYGWEIGAHSVTHPLLASFNPNVSQPNPLTQTQVIQELIMSKSALAAQGINATSFASPYGDYNNFLRQEISKYFVAHRGFADQGTNTWPYNDSLLQNMQVQAGVSVETVKQRIDKAIANKEWLILTFHDISTKPSTIPSDFEYSTANLKAIAAYVKSKRDAGVIKNTTVTEGTVNSSTNLVTNGNFSEGLSAGWWTNTPNFTTANTYDNGSYPDAKNSIKLTSSTTNTHLFSPRVDVRRDTTYLIRSFLNVQKISNGEVGYYIDEFDINGNWISGQYKTKESSPFVETMNMLYTPSSIKVARASLQIYTTANSAAIAYVDDVRWEVASTSTTPQIDLMRGGKFENGFESWTNDAADVFMYNSQGNGAPSNPSGSIGISINNPTKSSQLFSPRITINPSDTYYMTQYFDIRSISNGSLGIYIDEYDLAGNWISGQYKTDIVSTGARTIGVSYKPSSNAVVSASLQVIVPPAISVSAYFDDSRWYRVQ